MPVPLGQRTIVNCAFSERFSSFRMFSFFFSVVPFFWYLYIYYINIHVLVLLSLYNIRVMEYTSENNHFHNVGFGGEKIRKWTKTINIHIMHRTYSSLKA